MDGRVGAVLTNDQAKAGPFIIGAHQALLLVMCWKMGSNSVIYFMHPACAPQIVCRHTFTHRVENVHAKTNVQIHTKNCINTSVIQNAHAAVHYINVCKVVPKQAFINRRITKCNVTVCVYRSFKVTTHFLSPCEVAKVKAQSYIKKAQQHKHVCTSTHSYLLLELKQNAHLKPQ